MLPRSDVTQERVYEQELYQKNRTLETIFTTMDCGVMCHSMDGSRILSINRAALEILGYETLEEMPGGVVPLHVPDVGVAPALDLLLGLVHRAAKAVVDLLVDAVLILIPDQAGDAVDGGLQVLAGLPGVLPFPAIPADRPGGGESVPPAGGCPGADP